MEGEVKVTTPEGEAVEFGTGRSGHLSARAEMQLGGAQADPQALSLHLGPSHYSEAREGQTLVALETPAGELGWQAEDFTLKDAYGNSYRLYDLKGATGTLVMFICNHCPYVRAVADRIARDARDLQKRGIGVIAVMPNDYVRYPDDAPEQMKRFAQQHSFSFPYVVDETQEVARAYRALCTPEFFGFNADRELQYRGRLDASRTTLVPDARRELFEAMC
jgi:peroxiredoxin